MTTIETDYLVVGAGASGMAFADALIADSPADVMLVDRRHRPGGHWNDDYPFVRLHTPSTWYGVNSRRLGEDRIDGTGPNAGFYERATAAEVCDYYNRVLEENLLPSGQVRFLGMCDYLSDGAGEHRVASLLTGDTTTVKVRRKLVDATYMETSIPSKHTPSFGIDPGARVIAPNDLVTLSEAATGYTIIGAGKTAMDSCCWLIDQGVPPDAIRWIRPRDPWTFDRAALQPLKLIGSFFSTFATFLEAAAEATDTADLFDRLEAAGVVFRFDREVEPTVLRGATLSAGERATLQRISNVVRLGRVRQIGTDQIQLDAGTIPTDAAQVHVDCTAAGIGAPPTRPIFEPDRITIQRIQFGNDPFSPALIGHVEATKADDDEKNRLCPPVPFTGEAADIPESLLVSLQAQMEWMSDPGVGEWFNNSRLSFFHGVAEHLTDTEGQEALMRLMQTTGPAIENLERLVGKRLSPSLT